MEVQFCDGSMQELYSKGFSNGYPDIPQHIVKDYLIALTMARAASCVEDIIQPPPFKGLLQDDGSCRLFLRDGWQLDFLLELTDSGNRITVISLTHINEGENYE